MFERFSKNAKTAVTTAVDEASRRGDRRVGTEHLLLALLDDERIAALVGADLAAGRAQLDAMDREALAGVGVDVTSLGSHPPVRSRGHRPFTGAAKAALTRSLVEAQQLGDRRLEPEHLLLAVLHGEPPDSAIALLGKLGVDPADLRARLRRAA